jgi:hypothetical protein
MSRAKIIFLFSLLFAMVVSGQNKQLIYGLDEVPQNLLLNPGGVPQGRAYIGVPGLSGLHLNAGSSGFSLYDVAASDGQLPATRITSLIQNLDDKDFVTTTVQLGLIDVGWRKDDETFFSAGLYQEFDLIAYFPKDWATLAWYGNANYLDYPFKFEHISARADVLSVFHFGINKKINRKWHVGGRLKLYNSLVSANSLANTGSFTTRLANNGDSQNIYAQELSGAAVSIQTSGLSRFEGNVTQSEVLNTGLFGGDLGLGIDVGATYQHDDAWRFSASLLDIGAIAHGSDVKTYQASGDYNLEGIQLEFPNLSQGQTAPPYYAIFENEVEAAVPIDTLYSSYTQWRPVKLNASATYAFGPSAPGSVACNCSGKGDPYKLESEVGIQIYAIKRPKTIQTAISLFYVSRLLRQLTVKSTWTMDALSYANLGLALVGDLGPINVYLAGDHLLRYGNLAKARGASIQLGVNVKLERR